MRQNGSRKLTRWSAALLVGLALFGVAARRPSGGGGSLSINEPAPYHFGQTMTFTVSAPGVSQPFVVNECYQNGVKVYGEVHGYFPGYIYGQTYTLGPTTKWTGGAADCTARLTDESRKNPVVLASVSYHVDA